MPFSVCEGYIMDVGQEEALIQEIRQNITESVPLGRLTDEGLEERIEQIVQQRLAVKGQYCSIEQRISIVQQIFSSIRGFGLLDTIMSDDSPRLPRRSIRLLAACAG